MKKILMAAAIVGAFVATPASAQWYLGGGVGAGHAKLGNNGTIQGNDSYDTSAKVFGGYNFTPNWGIEGQYAYLGKYDYSFPGGSGSYKPESWGLAATGTLPLPHNFYLMAKLGAAFNRLRDNNIGSGNKTDLLVGAGAGYNFTPNWGLRLEYENFGKMAKNINGGGDVKGENWAVSVKYTF
ncbi:MAG TPA: outer membrane beta-barrel protein [Burkholderiales bacterium]